MQLSPLDLLTFYDSEQDVIRCLIRRPKLTAVEISKFTKIPLNELESVLNKLVKGARLSTDTADGNQIFSVAYAKGTNHKKAGGPSLLDSLFG